MELTHLNDGGEAHMVDTGAKADTVRIAEARGTVSMNDAAYGAIVRGDLKKGDALGAARIAGIMAAKKTSDLIPLCHPLALTKVEVRVEPAEGGLSVTARARTSGQTGVEMEALTAVSVACLTVYDMLKAADKAMTIETIRLLAKSGGKSGDWVRP